MYAASISLSASYLLHSCWTEVARWFNAGQLVRTNKTTLERENVTGQT